MHVLARGSWRQRVRLAAGLLLFTFAGFHFFNTALALVSLEAVETFDHWRTAVTRFPPVSILLGAALFVHIGLALEKLARRSTLRLPRWELFQIASGLSIPFLLFPHIVNTRVASTLFGVHDIYPYEFIKLWPESAIWQSLLLLLVWVHGCVGMHFWLRLTSGYRRIAPVLLVLATLLPSAGIAGFAAGGAMMKPITSDPEKLAAFKASVKWPTAQAATIATYREWTRYGFGGLLTGVGLIVLGRMLFQRRRRRIAISYVGGPEIITPVGPTLLEVSRANRVPHACVCGGRARCSTCRVQVVSGIEALAPPNAAERATLSSIRAPADTRLACQIRVVEPSTVIRIVTPGRASVVDRNEAVNRQGEERTLAVLFFDVRNFTELTEGRLPYDVVYMLNHLFTAVSEAIESEGGWIDKYMGDGLMALFGRESGPNVGCQQALRAARAIDRAVEKVSGELKSEVGKSLQFGMGLHAGPLVLGEIGPRQGGRLTVIGNAVNTASRLEGLTKSPPCQLIFSRAIADLSGVDVRGLSGQTLEVRGVSDRIEIFRVPRARDLLPNFDRGRTKLPPVPGRGDRRAKGAGRAVR